MGYIRLVRSGGRHCLADAACFLKDFKCVKDLSEMLTEKGIPDITKKAAAHLISDMKNLVHNFEEATEYFKLLVNAFAPVFRNSKNHHLKIFYAIVPPLTINFVEHSLMLKDHLNKRNQDGAGFTDDGFAIGLAYIIALLDQRSQLNTLHWFQSVREKHLNARKDVEQQKVKTGKSDDKLQHTLSLSEKRIETFENVSINKLQFTNVLQLINCNTFIPHSFFFRNFYCCIIILKVPKYFLKVDYYVL